MHAQRYLQQTNSMMAKIIEKTGSRVLDDMRKFVMKASPTTSAEVEDRMHLPYSALPYQALAKIS